MKISPDTVSLSYDDAMLLSYGLANVIAEDGDPQSQRALDYICGMQAVVMQAHAVRRRYLQGETFSDDDVKTAVRSQGDVIVMIRDEFLIGSLQKAAEIVAWQSAEVGNDVVSEDFIRRASSLLVDFVELDSNPTTTDII